MKTIVFLTLAAALSTGVHAEERTRTKTFDGPKYEGSKTVTRDAAAGTRSVDATATRKSDGAVSTRTADFSHADGNVSAAGSSTGFNGKTRSFDYDRTRTETGATSSGHFTGHDGQTYTLTGERLKTDTGFTANQHITDGAGANVYNRDVAVSRANGQVARSVNVTRAEGFHAPRAVRNGPGRRR